MKRRALFTAMTASCLLATSAVDAQRYSSPAYTPPPPRYTPPPPPPAPRYTPPPASNQNTRQGNQSGSTYQGTQQRSGTSGGNLGSYRPGSIANSNSQSSGKLSGASASGSGARITGSSAQSGTGGAKKSAGSGTAKQAGTATLGKGKSTPANDTAKAGAKAGPKTAAQSAGAGAFGAKPAASGNVAQASSTKTPSAVMGNRTVAGANSLDTRKKQQSNEEFCKGANLSSTRCQFNCASLSPRPSYCPPGGPQVVKTETPQRVLNPPGPR